MNIQEIHPAALNAMILAGIIAVLVFVLILEIQACHRGAISRAAERCEHEKVESDRLEMLAEQRRAHWQQQKWERAEREKSIARWGAELAKPATKMANSGKNDDLGMIFRNLSEAWGGQPSKVEKAPHEKAQ